MSKETWLFIFAAVQATGTILQVFGVRIPLLPKATSMIPAKASRVTLLLSVGTLIVASLGLWSVYSRRSTGFVETPPSVRGRQNIY
jgi:hypothetical protein